MAAPMTTIVGLPSKVKAPDFGKCIEIMASSRVPFECNDIAVNHETAVLEGSAVIAMTLRIVDMGNVKEIGDSSRVIYGKDIESVKEGSIG